MDGLSPETRDALEGSRFDLGGFLTTETAVNLAETLVDAAAGDETFLCYDNGNGQFPTYIKLPRDANRTQV